MARNHIDLDKTGSPAFPDERLHSLPEAEDAFRWNHPECASLSPGSLRWIGSNGNAGQLDEAEAGIKITSMDCSLPGSSVCGILKGRILEWEAIPFSRGT